MTKEDRQEVEFYKGNAVQQMLQGDRLTEDEKKIVRAAILTARKDKPNMVLIREADSLLKEIAKTREITEPTVDIETISPIMTRTLEAMKYDQISRKIKFADRVNAGIIYALVFVAIIIAMSWKDLGIIFKRDNIKYVPNSKKEAMAYYTLTGKTLGEENGSKWIK